MPWRLVVEELLLGSAPITEPFYCGDEEWSRACSRWITGQEVVASMSDRNTRVWLFRQQVDGQLVGFGSLGPTKWSSPHPDGPRIPMSMIPMMAVVSRFQGAPENAPKPQRYARQILTYLVTEAGKAAPDYLGLTVHQHNAKAQSLYRAFAFHEHGRTPPHIKMVRLLRESTAP